MIKINSLSFSLLPLHLHLEFLYLLSQTIIETISLLLSLLKRLPYLIPLALCLSQLLLSELHLLLVHPAEILLQPLCLPFSET